MTDWKELEVLNGITYHKYPDEPVNGVVEYHYKNGQPNIRKSYKDGKRDGLSEKYHNNGQFHYGRQRDRARKTVDEQSWRTLPHRLQGHRAKHDRVPK